MTNSEFRSWALRGAEQRLIAIGEEAKAIFRNFPELRGRGRGFDAAKVPDGTSGKQPQRPGRPRRKMSAAGRKRISEAQKARWAKRREEKVQPAGERPKARTAQKKR